MRRVAPAIALLAFAACGSSSTTAHRDAASTLKAAAAATAQAHSFVITLPGAEITYQAPDRVQQVEHGMATGASATNGGSTSSSGPHPSTITKVFTADRYYEASDAGGAATFSSSKRCPNDQNAAEYVLRLLRAIASTGDAERNEESFSFHLKDDAVDLPKTGTATIDGGFIRTLSVGPSAGVPAFTITSVGQAPPVTEPSSSTPAEVTCG